MIKQKLAEGWSHEEIINYAHQSGIDVFPHKALTYEGRVVEFVLFDDTEPRRLGDALYAKEALYRSSTFKAYAWLIFTDEECTKSIAFAHSDKRLGSYVLLAAWDEGIPVYTVEEAGTDNPPFHMLNVSSEPIVPLILQMAGHRQSTAQSRGAITLEKPRPMTLNVIDMRPLCDCEVNDIAGNHDLLLPHSMIKECIDEHYPRFKDGFDCLFVDREEEASVPEDY